MNPQFVLIMNFKRVFQISYLKRNESDLGGLDKMNKVILIFYALKKQSSVHEFISSMSSRFGKKCREFQ